MDVRARKVPVVGRILSLIQSGVPKTDLYLRLIKHLADSGSDRSAHGGVCNCSSNDIEGGTCANKCEWGQVRNRIRFPLRSSCCEINEVLGNMHISTMLRCPIREYETADASG